MKPHLLFWASRMMGCGCAIQGIDGNKEPAAASSPSPPPLISLPAAASSPPAAAPLLAAAPLFAAAPLLVASPLLIRRCCSSPRCCFSLARHSSPRCRSSPCSLLLLLVIVAAPLLAAAPLDLSSLPLLSSVFLRHLFFRDRSIALVSTSLYGVAVFLHDASSTQRKGTNKCEHGTFCTPVIRPLVIPWLA